MFRIVVAGLATVFSLSAGCAGAQTPPEGLTWMVLNEINGAYFDRAEPMNRPSLVTEVPAGVIQAVDISHDGVTDWLIDYSDLGLSYCGTGGCLRTLYVSHDGDQYLLAFDEQALGFDVVERDGEAVIDARVHHGFCVPDDWSCAFAWAWDAGAKRLVERPNARGVTLLSNGGMDPVGASAPARAAPDNLPAALSDIWRQTRTACASNANDDGVEIRRATFLSTPDLNGDAVRDWIVTPPYACPTPTGEEAASPGFSVYLSGPDGEVTEAYVSEPDSWPAVDIAGTPALLIDNLIQTETHISARASTIPPLRIGPFGCGYRLTCPNRPLRWDVTASRFIPAD